MMYPRAPRFCCPSYMDGPHLLDCVCLTEPIPASVTCEGDNLSKPRLCGDPATMRLQDDDGTLWYACPHCANIAQGVPLTTVQHRRVRIVEVYNIEIPNGIDPQSLERMHPNTIRTFECDEVELSVEIWPAMGDEPSSPTRSTD